MILKIKFLLTILLLALWIIYFLHGWIHTLYDTSPENLIQENIQDIAFTWNIIVVWAWAAGLAAGSLLEKYWVDYKIIEATDRYWWRVQEHETFADFPIDLWAEWIHQQKDILQKLVWQDTLIDQIKTIPYTIQDVYNRDGETYKKINPITLRIQQRAYPESKFKQTTRFDYLEQKTLLIKLVIT